MIRVLEEEFFKLEAARAKTESEMADVHHAHQCRIIELVNKAESKLHYNEIEELRVSLADLQKQLAVATNELQISTSREHELEDEVGKLNARLENKVPITIHEGVIDENEQLRKLLEDLLLNTNHLVDPNLLGSANDKIKNLKKEVQRLHNDARNMCHKLLLAEFNDEIQRLKHEINRLRKALEGMMPLDEYQAICDERNDLQTQALRLRLQLDSENKVPRANLDAATQEAEDLRAEVVRLNQVYIIIYQY